MDTHRRDDLVDVSREYDLEVEVLERCAEPVDGRTGLSWRRDRFTSNVESLVESGQELTEEDSEAVGARLGRPLDDRASQSRGRDGERRESQSSTADGTD